MASRMLTFVSCTLYYIFVVNIILIGFASFIIGTIGISLFISTFIAYKTYENNTCLIVDIEYDSSKSSCYYIMWSVEYYILNSKSNQYTFSTIKKTYKTSDQVLNKIATHKLGSNHICYYDKTKIFNVQWDKPSLKPYVIMSTIGFSLTGLYLIIIGIFEFYRYRKLRI